MKVAIVHYWLVRMRGGEKVLEAICELYPEADIFTHVVNPAKISETINNHAISTTFINKLPWSRTHYQNYLPLMPIALEQLDLSEYDLIISSESGPAKGVITRPDAVHICYCHTPMRYVWDMYHEYLNRQNFFKRLLMRPLLHYIRTWDFQSAARVDHFICNSNYVAQRVKKVYRR
ncbi:MAG: glycosyltransferase, partial [Proteobacteria bacterium]|nr:glycosyltransferase [Pseudomonadota bacterium]